ncbi:MAG TPA: hypothetical protein VFE86_06890 [Ilumatobacteraceae bacterium]|nr:hypothetical protein [Ilumatobacteraceae bacterium]
MSRKSEAKRARRDKRRATRDVNWIPDAVLEEMVDGVELVEDLETFDARITQRGWTFDEDQSDEEFIIWFYPPSGAAVGKGVEPVTTIWMHVTENAEIVHVILVGTADDRQMTPDDFFEKVDAIESYRSGDSTTP